MQEKQYPSCNFLIAQAKIYSLADQHGNVFYIGFTVNRMEVRLGQHISAAKNNTKYTNKRKNELIRRLDYEIVCTVIDMAWFTGENKYQLRDKARKLEKQWVKKYFDLGYQLCNGRLPIVKKSAKLGNDYIGKTVKTRASDGVNQNYWIKIESISEGIDQDMQVQRK